jgi:hypothetical protein
MKTVLYVVAAALALTGCSKKSESGAAAGGPCADAMAKAVGAMPGGPGAGDVQAKLKTILTTRCTEDKWPAAVVDCYAKSTDMMSMKQCREMLPADQKEKVIGEIRAVMMAGGGAAGPMHGASAPAPSAPADTTK